MSIKDEIDRIDRERITGPKQNDTASYEDIAGVPPGPDSNDREHYRIQEELAEIKRDVKEILRLLKERE